MATCAICGQKVVFKKVLVKGFKCVCFDCVKAAGYSPFAWFGNMITTVPELRERIVKLHPERELLLLHEPIPTSDEGCYLERLGTEIKKRQENNRQKRGDIGLGTIILIALLLTPFGVLSELMKDKKW